MKSAAWYIVHEGRKILAATKAEARHVAQLVADHTGKRVTVRPIKSAAPTRKPANGAKRTMRRNPDPGSFLDVWREQEKHRQARLDYGKATKARRLAKGMRGRDRGGAVKAAERGAQKSAKFALDVRGKMNGVLQSFTLYRASRRAAEDLAGQYVAAGCKVVLREV